MKRVLSIIIVCLFFVFITFSVKSDNVKTLVDDGKYGYITESEEVFKVNDYVTHIINHGTGIFDTTQTAEGRLTHIYESIMPIASYSLSNLSSLSSTASTSLGLVISIPNDIWPSSE